MAKRYDAQTDLLFQWLRRYTDTADWGFRSGRDGVLSANTSETLEAGLAKLRWPTRLCKRVVETHRRFLSPTGPRCVDTIYYRCRRSAEVHPLMLDFDAHCGEPDVLDLSDHVLSLFPGCYREPSTSYSGFHAYLHAWVGCVPRSLFNTLAGVFAEALAAIAAENNYEAKVEVKGLCTLLTRDRQFILKRGTLAKVPRLAKGAMDAEALTSSPVFTVADLRRVVDTAPPDLGLSEAWAGAVMEHYGLFQNVPAGLGLLGPQDGRVRRGSAPRPRRRLGILKGSVGESPDALYRMYHACAALARSLGRVPDVDELLASYEEQGLNTGEDYGRRRSSRAVAAIQHCESSFDPALAKLGGYSDAAADLVDAVRRHVQPEHRRDTCYRYRVTDEDLAVTLYAVTRGSLRLEFECGNGSIQAMFAALRSDGVIKRSCDRNKAVAMKTILERAGLITCRSEDYAFGPGVRPKVKEYAIGPAHPQYEEFQAMLERHLEPAAAAATRRAA